jgi:ceramide synthetase
MFIRLFVGLESGQNWYFSSYYSWFRWYTTRGIRSDNSKTSFIWFIIAIINDWKGAKLMTYVKKQRLADSIFVVFTICWMVSRIGLLPYRILYYSTYKALSIVPMFPAYYIFNGLLCALQALHIVWTWFIVRIAIHAVKYNGVSHLLF